MSRRPGAYAERGQSRFLSGTRSLLGVVRGQLPRRTLPLSLLQRRTFFAFSLSAERLRHGSPCIEFSLLSRYLELLLGPGFRSFLAQNLQWQVVIERQGTASLDPLDHLPHGLFERVRRSVVE